jgi:O-succinylbenzoic acid--CoA ligase
MRVDNWLLRSAAATPDRVAVIAGDERLTYAELERRAVVAARRLSTLGAGEGDRVGLTAAPAIDYVVLLHALMKLGAVAVPLDASVGQSGLERLAASAGVSLLVGDLREVEDARESDVALARGLHLDAPHCVVHTSGTGGAPKPVELTYGNHLWSAFGSGVRIGIDPDDRWLCCLPPHRIGGLSIVLRSAIAGTAIVLERFDPARVAEVVRAERITLVSLVATMLGRLLDSGADLAPPRCVLLGGGPAVEGLIDRALDGGVALAPTYGLTEAASQVATLPPGEARRRPGSAGPPLLPTDVRIADDGTILVRGPTVAPGMAAADGWLRTGDLGRLDEDGHLYVEGRADDVIITGGENVVPDEVEEVLRSHPAVADAAVAGREDAEWQQAVIAAIVLCDGASVDEAELRELCRSRLAGFKVPKEIRFVERLPRDEQGKLRRREI